MVPIVRLTWHPTLLPRRSPSLNLQTCMRLRGPPRLTNSSSYWIPSDSYTTYAHIPPPNPIQTVDPSLAQLSSIITDTKTAPALIVQKTSTSPLSGYMKIPQDSLDEWLEETSRLQFHAKDPYHRVDCLPTDRQIRIEIDGVVLADTAGKGGVMSLWETRFPGRWYLPRSSVSKCVQVIDLTS